MVLGPPRSGKTTAVVIPNVLAAPGPVVTTSTKPDVLRATIEARSALGRCWLFDPSGTVPTPEGATRLSWSPVAVSNRWDEALVTARVMVGAARPGGRLGEAAHWNERAEALLGSLLHAAACCGGDMTTVVQWVLAHDAGPARAAVSGHGATLASAVLAGLAATDDREMSAIWSTAGGVLAAYRSDAVLAQSVHTNFDPYRFPATSDTVYICAPARYQALVAPIVVAFMEQVRAATYQAAARDDPTLPVTMVLDEVANIAPLPDLPSMVSEGGGQGLLTLACLQDLSQARYRWGAQADGFPSLFGTKLLLPGIADLQTLQLVSQLCGEVDVPQRSTSRGPWWGPGRGAPTVSWSNHRQARLPIDTVRQLAPGSGIIIAGSDPPAQVALPPWWSAPVLHPPAAPERPDPGLSQRHRSRPQVQRRHDLGLQ
jgi:type IV secretory pathway TraG/TraD family ATPase VirD4